MSFSTITSIALSTLLLASCATTPSGQTFDSPVGVWGEKYKTKSSKIRSGKVTIIDETKGTYINSGGVDGRIEFFSVEDQRTWKGYWILEDGSYPCSTEKGGSRFWGEYIFVFNEAYNQYAGTWDSCGEGTKYSTKGLR